jgi:hypothetical protein
MQLAAVTERFETERADDGRRAPAPSDQNRLLKTPLVWRVPSGGLLNTARRLVTDIQ